MLTKLSKTSLVTRKLVAGLIVSAFYLPLIAACIFGEYLLVRTYATSYTLLAWTTGVVVAAPVIPGIPIFAWLSRLEQISHCIDIS